MNKIKKSSLEIQQKLKAGKTWYEIWTENKKRYRRSTCHYWFKKLSTGKS